MTFATVGLEFPDSVAEIVEEATKYGKDIDKAVQSAERRIRQLPEFDDFVGKLITMSVRHLVYDCRHKANVAFKRSTGAYDVPNKVFNGEELTRIYSSVYDYFIGGTRLGLLKGEELKPIAESERAKSDGHAFNARLCDKLSPMVPEGKEVRECVPEVKLQRIFDEARSELGSDGRPQSGRNGRRKSRRSSATVES